MSFRGFLNPQKLGVHVFFSLDVHMHVFHLMSLSPQIKKKKERERDFGPPSHGNNLTSPTLKILMSIKLIKCLFLHFLTCSHMCNAVELTLQLWLFDRHRHGAQICLSSYPLTPTYFFPPATLLWWKKNRNWHLSPLPSQGISHILSTSLSHEVIYRLFIWNWLRQFKSNLLN